jgi:SAM-dependent methyltransferase
MSTTEFPHAFLPLLRCSSDGAALLESEVRSGAIGVVAARLQCTACGAVYRIEDGIARMLLEDGLSPEDRHEIAVRNLEYGCTDGEVFIPPAASWRSELSDLVEIPPFLKALQPLNDCKVIEFGCGDGRFTMLMAQLGARVMAVDFSINALQRMAGWLPSGTAPTAFRVRAARSGDLRPYIGLIHADASRFHVGPRSFQRALSATPLDSRDQRMAMYRTIAEALADDGRYIGSFEHDDLIRRLLGLPLARRYEHGGIFIEHFDAATIQREASPYFLQQRVARIRTKIPFFYRLPKTWSVPLLHAIGKTPCLAHLGEIILLKAERPVRAPAEGANRPGNKLVRAVFRWYLQRLGKQPVWGSDELVM